MLTILEIYILLACSVDLTRADGLNPQSAPAAGDMLIAEEPYTIQWEPGTDGPVSIGLKWNDDSWSEITAETQNNGSYEWTPSLSYAGFDDYFLGICDLVVENECTYTFDGRFSIAGVSALSSLSSQQPITSVVTIIPSLPSTSFPDTSSTSLASTTTTSTKQSSASSTTPTSPAVTPATATRSGLSIDAKIAIAVVLGVVGTVLVGLAFFFTLRCWKRRNRETNAVVRPEETHKHENRMVHERAELEGDPALAIAPSGHGSQAWEGTGRDNKTTINPIHDLPEWKR
ncbi:hypothetical protein K491DRAFT_674175 [Lophiostoma macrostomum CBS 122681]|uniref:Yeast cell wall synthesis Kre9/Knh1-like N-terminal domain-containing protein n=1 Tax=Lophiostoma macrostomum CBS 122681 TaxID=1314788 RepID=A0A6A6TN76_9PLEO|nr:hypothetical protein K491DRAFT_674175 [Lophiostoma macrostomum CBS 122681]